jgi:hypothetical protein
MERTKMDIAPSFKIIWKSKLSEKIKIFTWLVAQGAILTKDNMLKRKWQGSPVVTCVGNLRIWTIYCFLCRVAKVMWGVVAMCFHQTTRPSSYAPY